MTDQIHRYVFLTQIQFARLDFCRAELERFSLSRSAWYRIYIWNSKDDDLIFVTVIQSANIGTTTENKQRETFDSLLGDKWGDSMSSLLSCSPTWPTITKLNPVSSTRADSGILTNGLIVMKGQCRTFFFDIFYRKRFQSILISLVLKLSGASVKESAFFSWSLIFFKFFYMFWMWIGFFSAVTSYPASRLWLDSKVKSGRRKKSCCIERGLEQEYRVPERERYWRTIGK